MKIIASFALCVFLLLLAPTPRVHAHFFWLVPQKSNGSEVQLYFSEGPEADNPKLLEKLNGLSVEAYLSDRDRTTTHLALSEDRSTLSAAHRGATAWRLNHTYGLHGRETKNLILYTAMSVPCGWEGMGEKDRVHLPQEGFTAEPNWDGKELAIQLMKDGKPIANTEVELQSPNDHRSLVTDAEGRIRAEGIEPGVYAIRCLTTDATPGTHEGVAYAAVKHYTTISFLVPNLSRATALAESASPIGELPKAITSFGAAKVDESLYVYGGHTGGAHSYSNEEQFNQLARLIPSKGSWEIIAEGPRVQGNALVPYGDHVILVGGFSAENKTGEKSRLVSQSGVMMFDTQSQRWVSLPDLPEPRSSMDATILDSTLYVVGGWTMNGNSSETQWLKTGWMLDMKDQEEGWKPMAAPPFERRAMAVTAHEGKVFVIGGMDSDSSPTTACHVYDPKTNTWSELDAIAGMPMNGFGAAAASVGGQLLVSTVDGSIQRWKGEEGIWEIVGAVPNGRFFHRMLPLTDRSFVILGGAHMDVGKFRESLIVELQP